MSVLALAPLLAIDTETTGMHPDQGHRVVEVAAVPIDAGVVGEGWASLVRPGRPIPPDAARVHGISDSMVADAPTPAAVADALLERSGARAWVMHNAPFDLPFLLALFRDAARPAPAPVIVDTLGLARGLLGPGGNRLGELAAKLGLPAETQHRALGDATTTARLAVVLAERWTREKGVRSLEELAAASLDVMRVTARR